MSRVVSIGRAQVDGEIVASIIEMTEEERSDGLAVDSCGSSIRTGQCFIHTSLALTRASICLTTLTAHMLECKISTRTTRAYEGLQLMVVQISYCTALSQPKSLL